MEAGRAGPWRALGGGGEARRARQGCGACSWVDPSHPVGGKLEAQNFEVTASLEAGRGRPGRLGPARGPARGGGRARSAESAEDKDPLKVRSVGHTGRSWGGTSVPLR